MFNLQNNSSLKMNLDMNCKLYNYDLEKQNLVIMESIHVDRES
jgi:hypothetical protein